MCEKMFERFLKMRRSLDKNICGHKHHKKTQRHSLFWQLKCLYCQGIVIIDPKKRKLRCFSASFLRLSLFYRSNTRPFNCTKIECIEVFFIKNVFDLSFNILKLTNTYKTFHPGIRISVLLFLLPPLRAHGGSRSAQSWPPTPHTKPVVWLVPLHMEVRWGVGGHREAADFTSSHGVR